MMTVIKITRSIIACEALGECLCLQVVWVGTLLEVQTLKAFMIVKEFFFLDDTVQRSLNPYLQLGLSAHLRTRKVAQWLGEAAISP